MMCMLCITILERSLCAISSVSWVVLLALLARLYQARRQLKLPLALMMRIVPERSRVAIA